MVVQALEKIKNINPTIFILMLTLFFIPISPSLKSIFVILSLISILVHQVEKKFLCFILEESAVRSVFLLFFVIFLGCFWSEADFSVKLHTLEKNIKLLFLPVLMMGFISKKNRDYSLYGFLGAMTLICLLSFLKALGLDLHTSSDPTYIGDAGAIFHNHIITAFMMAMAAYIAAVQAMQSEGKKIFLFAVLAMVFSLQILFVGTGKMGLIIYIALVFTFILQFLTKKQLVRGFTLTGVILLIFMGSSLSFNGATREFVLDYQRLKQGQKESSIGYRLQFHHFAKDLFLEKPITGYGTGGFGYQFKIRNPVPEWGNYLPDPHSQYWLTASELGLLGILALLYFFVSLFKSARHLNTTKPLLIGLLVAFMIGNASDALLFYSTVGYFFIMMTALCLGERLQILASMRQTRVV